MNRILFSFLISIVTLPHLYGQQTQSTVIDIIGIVTDESGNTLPGVTIFIKGSTIATVTDEKGRYNLFHTTNSKNIYICTSYLGMVQESTRFKHQKEIDFTLHRDPNTILDEVLIKANTNINDIDIRAKSGVVSQIDIKTVINKPTINLGVSLQGNTPGLSIINTGELGSNPEIRIRGNSSFREGNIANEPLYVLDGQIISTTSFTALNPQDIDDIKVLKDAVACALYGIKAANGVLEITTKRGHIGPTAVTYSFNMGITGKGPRSRRMMNSTDKLELERLMKSNKVITPGYFLSPDYINDELNSLESVSSNLSQYFYLPPNLSRKEYLKHGEAYLDSLRSIDTNWFEELMRITLYQNHSLSIRGGTENLSYYSSINFAQQGGQLPGNDQKRISGRLSIDWMLGKIGYLSLSVNSGYDNTVSPNSSRYPLTELIYNLNPYETKSSPSLFSYPSRTYSDLMGQYRSDSNKKKAGGSLSFSLTPLNGLMVSGSAGLDYLSSEHKSVTPATAFEELQSGVKESERGRISKGKNDDFNFSLNFRTNYNTVYNDVHDITIGGNIDYYYTSVDHLGVTGYGIGLLDELYAINQSIEGSRKPRINSFREKSAQVGIGLLGGYSYNQTYDLFATYKADASSILPKNKRWNAAWAIGLGINLEQYPFLQGNKCLTQFNIKGSYGWTANIAGITSAATNPTFSYQNSYYGDHRVLSLSSMFNNQLKPEQTSSLEIGTNLTFYKRLHLGFQYYKRNTKEALLSVPIPSSSGFTEMTRNVGELSNEGYEVNASIEILNTDVWRISTRTNFSFNRSKVIDLYDGDKMFFSDEAIIPDYEVGKSYNILYGLESLGIDPYNGYPVILKHDGTQQHMNKPITRSDFKDLGLSTPPINGMFGFSASYKNLDFDCSFYYVLGGKKTYSFTYVRFPDNINKNAIYNQQNQMWFHEGDLDKTYPSPYIDTATANNMQLYANSKMIAKSDYLRLSTISLRYRLPQRVLQRMGGVINYASLAFQGSNLFTWSPYKSSSPEAGSLDLAIQPIYSFNIQITL